MPHRKMFLPSSKAEFPKGIYLDQNIWSDLAKFHYGKIKDLGHRNALKAIIKTLDDNTALYPLGFTNFEETKNIPCLGTRLKISRFMVDLAKNIFILSPLLITKYEIINAVRKRVAEKLFTGPGNGLKITLIREHILWPGVHYVLGFPKLEGGTAELREYLFAEMHKAVVSVWVLSTPIGWDRQRALDDKVMTAAAEEIEKRGKAALKDLKEKERVNYEMLAFFTEGLSGAAFADELGKLEILKTAFFSLLSTRESCLELFNEVPSYAISAFLYLEHHKNYTRKTNRNDLNDVSYLSLAIPYFNGIVMEKYWATIAKQAGLDKKYDTIIKTKIKDIPALLAELGCL